MFQNIVSDESRLGTLEACVTYLTCDVFRSAKLFVALIQCVVWWLIGSAYDNMLRIAACVVNVLSADTTINILVTASLFQ